MVMQLTSFIGRTHELAEIAALLADPACRLLTLVGPGGIGKTRLALEAVNPSLNPSPFHFVHGEGLENHFPHGVHFVPLQSVSDAALLPIAIANALGIQFFGPDEPRAQLLEYLRERQTLLILDNFEQLLDGVDFVVELLSAPKMKILVTSRAALNIQAEWRYAVSGLEIPPIHPHPPAPSPLHGEGESKPLVLTRTPRDWDEGFENFDAVKLFTERARRLRHDFSLHEQQTHVIRICQLTEGMPLALELAAGWIRVMSCAEIADEIQRGLGFLAADVRDIPERHRSIAAAFSQSWHLLTDEEQAVFRKMSVFRGGFTRDAVTKVAGANLQILAMLVDKSFLKIDSTGRYDIHELLRQYSEAKLEAAGETEAIRDAHCKYFAGFMYQRAPELKCPEQVTSLQRIDEEMSNISLAWYWAVNHTIDSQIWQMMESLLIYCHVRGQFREAEGFFRMAAERLVQANHPNLYFHVFALRLRFRHEYIRDALHDDLFAKIPGMLRTVDFLIDLPMLNKLVAKGYERDLFNRDEAERILHLNLERYQARDDRWAMAWVHLSCGWVNWQDHQNDQAAIELEKSFEGFRSLGDKWSMLWPSGTLGELHIESGKLDHASRFLQEQLIVCRTIGDINGVTWSLYQLSSVALKTRDYTQAKQSLSQALEIDLGFDGGNGERLLMNSVRLLSAYHKMKLVATLLIRLRPYFETNFVYGLLDEVNERLDAIACSLPDDEYKMAVEQGQILDYKTAARMILQEFSTIEDLPALPSGVLEALTTRELEVLRLVAAGLSNRQIMGKLTLSLGTVKVHVHRIYGKLGVKSRTQAVARARELHLL